MVLRPVPAAGMVGEVMLKDEWPRFEHVRISPELINCQGDLIFLSAEAFRALCILTSVAANNMCHTYYGPAAYPNDGTIEWDEKSFCTALRLSRSQWAKVSEELRPYFKINKRGWKLDRDWISFEKPERRGNIAARIIEAVTRREGKKCTYCGDMNGPFDLDHIFPVARGGTDDPSNLTWACYRCNRSKGAKTLAEWVGR